MPRKPKPKAKKRKRTERRERERALVKQVRDREKLVAHTEGGSPGRAINVVSRAVIETRVRSMRCHQCDGDYEPPEIAAESTDAGLLRVATTRCRRCHTRRAIWFSIGPTVN